MSLSKNYVLNVIMTITGVLFPMITFPYISRVLMPEYIGKVTFAQSIIFYFTTLSLLGIPIYGTRELSKEKQNLTKFKQLLTELIVIGILGSLISFVIIFIGINFNSKLNEMKEILYIFSLQVIFSFLNLDYLFIVLEKHKRRALRALFIRIISIILMFIFVKTYKDYKVYVLILVIPEILMRLLDFISIKEYLNFKVNLNLKKHIKSLSILFISTLSVSLYVSLDSTMLGVIIGDSSVGLYASASKMSKVLIPLIIALETVIAPQLIYNIKENNKQKIFEKIDMFLDFNFILGIQFIFILFLLSKDVILLFSGEKFLSASTAMQIMLPVIFFIPVGSFMSGKILISHNLEKLSLKFNLIGMLSNASLNYLLIPKYGILGAGFATMFTEGLMCILKSLRVKKIYPEYKIITKDRIKYILVGLVISVFLLSIKNKFVGYNYFVNILLIGSIYVFFYLGILVISKDRLILNLLEKIWKKSKKS
ncbi:flippase (plasmid) [Cetobacterium somerae]|uniref:flippase n=1 Tax=Cetobacterium somerae TaxID=188913 RepID=UPI003D767A45